MSNTNANSNNVNADPTAHLVVVDGNVLADLSINLTAAVMALSLAGLCDNDDVVEVRSLLARLSDSVGFNQIVYKLVEVTA